MQNRVGLIGIGLLGSAMSERLAASGLEVHGFDVDPSRGANISHARDSVQDVFDACDNVLLSLPTSPIARQVVEATQLRSGQLVVDTTTGEPDEMQEIASSVASQLATYAEATVAGSSKQMRTGEATIFLGCEERVVDRVRSVTDVLSARCFHLGDVGAASRFKLVHNLILGLHRAVLAEGLTFAEALGFEPASALQILQQTPAASGVMATKGTKMVEGNYETQAKLSQHLKDVRLILQEATKNRASSPLSEVHAELLEVAREMGFGDADNSAVIEAFRGRKK